jgi:hypothetical protein
VFVGGSARMPPKKKAKGTKAKPKPKAKAKPKELQITLLPDPARDPEAIKLGTLTYAVKHSGHGSFRVPFGSRSGPFRPSLAVPNISAEQG